MFQSLVRSSYISVISRGVTTANPTSALKALREITGAPLMDCKNALAEAGGDLEKAKVWISERSKAVAAKIAGRAAKQGLIGLSVNDSVGALVEVNCETDFVARGEDFQHLVNQQANAVMKGGSLPTDVILKVTGKVRENLILGGALRLQSPNGGVLGSYLHNKLGEGVGTSAAIVSLLSDEASEKDKLRELARAIAVQVVAAKPTVISKEQIPEDIRKKEEFKILEEAGEAFAGKPEKAKQGLVRGKMQKFYGDTCLNEQVFILGDHEGKLVRETLPKGVKIMGFIRMSVGGDSTSSSS
jgi:elongation factor Ts